MKKIIIIISLIFSYSLIACVSSAQLSSTVKHVEFLDDSRVCLVFIKDFKDYKISYTCPLYPGPVEANGIYIEAEKCPQIHQKIHGYVTSDDYGETNYLEFL